MEIIELHQLLFPHLQILLTTEEKNERVTPSPADGSEDWAI